MAYGLTQELKLRMGMQLVMTPQLQMAIRLLQMSSLDLAEYLQEELDKNPLLERDDSSSEGMDGEDPNAAQDKIAKSEDLLDAASPIMETNISDDLPVDADWSDVYSGDSFGAAQFETTGGSEAPPLENTLTRGDSLFDHLTWQLGVSAINDRERVLGMAIVDAVDENGYLSVDLAVLAEMVNASLDEMEDALLLVQSFDPSGVAARNLAECLLLQLKARKLAVPPYTLLLDRLEDLARRDYRKLKRILKLDDEDLADAVDVIQSLHPKPGLLFGSEQANYVIPDVFVRKQDGEWIVEINPETVPRLRINRTYEKAINDRMSEQDKRFMTENARSAQWLIKSLEQRSSTIYRVAESIVRFQKDFLEHGQEYLRPLILKDVADDIGVHESTASRVTSNKYMHTNRGIFELKFFFSSSLASDSGENHSSEAVKYKIRKLVENESARRPLSDEKLAKLLQEQGIAVARRTVAKYRDALNIPSSSRRKRLAPER
ncbi:MAG: RNA polymerase factor sigma-54 [Magnetococcales bacterium]|nr:RNA polymerase factor sigma-54 [Magnetococcales bacterium]